MYPYPEIPRARNAELRQQAERDALAIAIRRARRARGDRSGPPGAAARIIRSLAAAIARAGAAATHALGAIWAARPRLPGEPAAPPRPQTAAANSKDIPGQRQKHRPGAQPPATSRTAGAANSGTSVRT